MKKIAKNIDTAVEDFCKQLAARFDLDATEVFSLWKVSQSASVAKKSKGATKKSGYVMFGLEVRPLIGAEHPDWDFVAKSKEIGRRWTALSVEEKNRYKEMGIATATTAVAPEVDDEEIDMDATQIDNVDEEPPVAPASIKKKHAPATTAVTATAPVIQDEYMVMSLKDLKNVCKTKGVKVSGKREELLDRIRNAPVATATATATASIVAPIATKTANEDDDDEKDVGAGTPGSVGILPEGLDEEDDEEQDIAPALPKKKHKNDAFPAMASSVAVVTKTKKPSRWNKLSTEDLQSQCDDWDIDFEEDTPREELIRALDNYIH
jgi:hypothetical protein